MFSHTTTTIKPTKPTTTPHLLQTTTTHSCSRNKKCTGNIDRVIVSCKSKSKRRMTRSTYKIKKRQKTKERRQREIKRNTEEISPKNLSSVYSKTQRTPASRVSAQLSVNGFRNCATFVTRLTVIQVHSFY